MHPSAALQPDAARVRVPVVVPASSSVRVRPVRTPADLARAVVVRHTAYARHDGAWARTLERPEPVDASPHARVLIAEARTDAAVVGTVRLHVNRGAPLPVECAATLPPRFEGARMIEATRMAVAHPHSSLGRAARDALFKACWLHAIEQEAQWIVAAVHGPLERVYESLLFEDVFAPGRRFRLPYTPDFPYRVMALPLDHAASRWIAHRHPLLEYMLRVERAHDIEPAGADAADIAAAT